MIEVVTTKTIKLTRGGSVLIIDADDSLPPTSSARVLRQTSEKDADHRTAQAIAEFLDRPLTTHAKEVLIKRLQLQVKAEKAKRK